MKLNVNRISISAALGMGIVWIICSVLVLLGPSQMMLMSGSMFHSDFNGHGFNMAFGGLFIGLILWSLLAGVIAWFTATIYNLLDK